MHVVWNKQFLMCLKRNDINNYNVFDLIAVAPTQKFLILLASLSPGRNYLYEFKFYNAKVKRKKSAVGGN
jgi:hypothetical protein